MTSVQDQSAGRECRRFRQMSVIERSLQFAPVGKNPPISEIRNVPAYGLLLGNPPENFLSHSHLPYGEFFKLYFGWMGSGSGCYGRGYDEFTVALHALYATIDTLGLQRKYLANACEEASKDLFAIFETRGLRDYVFTTRDDTGRMWLEVAEGVFINELSQVPSESDGFEMNVEKGDDDSKIAVSMPRDCCSLFRRGEQVGTASVKVPLKEEIIEQFFTNRILCACHVEVGDDNEPFMVFISLARVRLKGHLQFVERRIRAFGWFPYEGISRAKRKPWSLYELMVEMIIARMISASEVERVGRICEKLTETWLIAHELKYVSREVLIRRHLCVEDLHLMLGCIGSRNRHIGAVTLAVFRAEMREFCSDSLSDVSLYAPFQSKRAENRMALQILNGKMYVKSNRNRNMILSGAGIIYTITLATGVVRNICNPVHTRLRSAFRWFAMGRGSVSKNTATRNARPLFPGIVIGSFTFFTSLVVASCPHEFWIKEWVTGRKRISCLSEAKRKLGNKWRLILSNPDSARRLASADGNIFGPDLPAGVVLPVDEDIYVSDLDLAMYDFGVEDGGHLVVRPPNGSFIRGKLSEQGFYLTFEECIGRVYVFNVKRTAFYRERIIAKPRCVSDLI